MSSLGKDWHRGCLKCTRCGKTLTSGGHAEVHCLFPINLSCAAVYLLKFGIWRICQKLIETGSNLYEIHHLIIIIKFPLTLLQHAKINIYLWTFWLPFVVNYFEMRGIEYFAPFSQSKIWICTFHAIKQKLLVVLLFINCRFVVKNDSKDWQVLSIWFIVQME